MVSSVVEDSDIIPVDPMDEAHAIALFRKNSRKKLGTEANRDNIIALTTTLEFIPLVIVQTAVYIKRRVRRLSVPQYLNDFQKSDSHKTSLFDYEAGHLAETEKPKVLLSSPGKYRSTLYGR